MGHLRALMAMAVLAVAAMVPPAPALAQAPGGGAAVTWRPEQPLQGRLFLVRVTPAAGVPLSEVRGQGGGESLRFFPGAQGAFESLVPVPVDATGPLTVELTLIRRDGRQEFRSVPVPIADGQFRHEELTVAPRFGAPPDSATQVRLARDRAKAAQVSRSAMDTPRLWTSDLVLPRESRVTSAFGDGRTFNGQVSSRHMGLDLNGSPGDTVVAVADGVVALVDQFVLAGNIVYLNHGGGLLSGYFHLSEQLVAAGDTVKAGTPIGRVGATGRVTGPHLHWVVRYGSTSVDGRSLLELADGSVAPHPPNPTS